MNTSTESYQNQTGGYRDPEIEFIKGEIDEENTDIDAAITHYSNALSYDKTYAKAYLKRAKCFAKLKDHDSAIKDYKSLLPFVAENDTISKAKLYYEIAELEVLKQNFKKALASINEAIAISPAYIQAFEFRGTIYAQLGEIENAILSFRHVKKLDDNYFHNSSDILFNLPLLDQEMPILEKINLTERAVKLHPTFETGHYNLGILYQQNNQIDKAINAFKNAHEISPKNLHHLIAICECLAEKQDYPNLKLYLEKAARLGDDHSKRNLGALNTYLEQLNKNERK